MSKVVQCAIVVTYRDGRTYGGANAAEVVRQIADGGIFTAGESNLHYMMGVAQRMRKFGDRCVRCTDEAQFLEDLERLGEILIRRMD